ncbi:MAG TPA: DUF4124 domain-containing protein [Longimicrobiaceae bacterium]|nr:DUF4124 domain-containing protein [Longimicrobiaceae bacterium]
MRRIRLLVLLAGLAGLAAFAMPAKDGRPLLDFAAVKTRFTDAARGGEESGGGVYKWKDDRGNWHYSNVRPEGRDGVQKVKETITWAKGSGGPAEPEAPRSEQPRSAAELLAESKRLGEKTEARETELQRVLREAQ